jgi:nicotinate-nucleotide adenylyltransferase
MRKTKKKKPKKAAASKRRAKHVARRSHKPARKRARVSKRTVAKRTGAKRAEAKRARVRRARAKKAQRTPAVSRHPMPPASPGMRIGLFGGSFNPPHEAHRAASLLALDRIWWLVTPGNPLKDNNKLPPLDERLKAARKLAAHPKIDVTGVEAELGTRYTFDTVTRLRQRRPGVDFVFIVGADNLAHFHRWERWRALLRAVPLAVVDRPEYELSSLAAPAAVAFASARVAEGRAKSLARHRPPAWTFLRGLKSELSSTALRKLALRKKLRGRRFAKAKPRAA